jgi:predicted amidohydrolase YtcJ
MFSEEVEVMTIAFRGRWLLGPALLMTLGWMAGCNEVTPAPEPADLVLRDGKFVTMDPSLPEAQALAVRGDRILAVGTDREIDTYVGPETEVIELSGMLAVPGLIESHGHFMGVGTAQLQLNLMDVANWDEVVAMVEAAVREAQPGEVIQGRGWHQEKWDRVPEPNVDGLPFHYSLSAVSPENPVVLRHASGHATYANAKAMELAGITRDTPDPPGGQIVRDANDDPVGAFRETASGLLGPATSSAPDPDPRRVAELANQEVLSKGITTFQDAGSGFSTVDLFKEMADDGSMGVRLWVMLRTSNERLAESIADYRLIGYGGNRLTVRAIKRSIDGALGPHGAWLLEPYRDLAESTGLNTSPVENIEETARIAMENDFQLCVHAIGDRANRETLDIFQQAFEANPTVRGPWRHRLDAGDSLYLGCALRPGAPGRAASGGGSLRVEEAPGFRCRDREWNGRTR